MLTNILEYCINLYKNEKLQKRDNNMVNNCTTEVTLKTHILLVFVCNVYMVVYVLCRYFLGIILLKRTLYSATVDISLCLNMFKIIVHQIFKENNLIPIEYRLCSRRTIIIGPNQYLYNYYP